MLQWKYKMHLRIVNQNVRAWYIWQVSRDIKRCIRAVEAAKKQEPRSEAITSNHGNFITEFMEQTRDEEHEYAAYFDLSSNKLAEGTLLSPYTCHVAKEDWYNIYCWGDKIISVHNHP